jgi:hypothetical protein
MPPRSRRKRNEETEQVAPIEATARAAKNLPVLRAAGYDARPVSQEHSNVPDLWQQFDRPLYLIYLNASLEEQRSRRQDVSWSVAAHQQEVLRLTHAREHADVRINTAELTPEGVYRVASTYLARQHVPRANHPLEALPATGSAAKSPPPDSSA